MAEPGIVFLMYHELELPPRPLCQSGPGYVRYILSQESFRSQMRWLAQNGWRGLSVGEALSYPSRNSVAITFDDGSETDLISAAPILKENRFGRKIEHFSCPGGRYDDRTRDLAREAGYRSLATSRAHANSSATNPYSLGRVAILRYTDSVTF